MSGALTMFFIHERFAVPKPQTSAGCCALHFRGDPFSQSYMLPSGRQCSLLCDAGLGPTGETGGWALGDGMVTAKHTDDDVIWPWVNINYHQNVVVVHIPIKTILFIFPMFTRGTGCWPIPI